MIESNLLGLLGSEGWEMTIGDRIKAHRKALGFSADYLAERLNISRATVFRYEKGEIEKIPVDMLEPLAQILNTTPANLMGWTEDKGLVASKAKEEKLLSNFNQLNVAGQDKIIEHTEELLEIPRYQKRFIAPPKVKPLTLVSVPVAYEAAAAGFGNYLDTTEFEEMDFPENEVPGGTDFGIRITGDSMQPEMDDGDIAFVKKQIEVEHMEIGIFILNGSAYCKRLMVDYEQREVRLVSLNKKYDDILVTEEDVLRTVGKVLF